MKFINYKGVINYSISMIDMEVIHDAVGAGEEECVLFLEHSCLYSVGKSYEVSDFVGNVHYKVYYTTRGGRITVHNIGQCVVYPIINLKQRNLNVHQYVTILEDWMIDAIARVGIVARRSDLGVGVWIDDAKVGFIGIRVTQGIATHGMCINVCNDLSPFDEIVPCGLKGVKVTSVSHALERSVTVQEFVEALQNCCPL